MDSSSPFDVMEPPPSDRDLSSATVRRVLREQFPWLGLRSVEPLGSGWERDVYLVDDRVVVHFPRYAGVAEGLERHDAILELVAASVGPAVSVPRITLWGQRGEHFPHRFFGHELIPGLGADDLAAPASAELAADLGQALSAIHSIPPKSAREMGIGAAGGDRRTALVDLVRQADRVHRLEALVPGPYEWLRSAPPVPAAYAGPPRVLHNDLQPEHILVDRGSGRLAGIIDWSGVALGDPTLDFSFLLLLHGRAFLDDALAAYRLPIDVDFIQRATFRARVRGLGWLVYTLYREADPARDLKAVGHAFSG